MSIDEILNGWRAVCDAATEGEWFKVYIPDQWDLYDEDNLGGRMLLRDTGDEALGIRAAGNQAERNADLCILSRTALPRAIEALEFAIDAIEMAHTADVPPNVTLVRDAFTRILSGETEKPHDSDT